MNDTLIDCPDCEGSGIEPGTYVAATWQEPSSAEPCGRCNGTGWTEGEVPNE